MPFSLSYGTSANSGVGPLDSVFNDSGWTVSTGRSTATSSATATNYTAWLIGGALLLMLLWKR